jgi:hypothetical protein
MSTTGRAGRADASSRNSGTIERDPSATRMQSVANNTV